MPNMSDARAPTGDTATEVDTFGPSKRESSKGQTLLTAEDLASNWKSAVYPRDAAGSRSYAFLGTLRGCSSRCCYIGLHRTVKVPLRCWKLPFWSMPRDNSDVTMHYGAANFYKSRTSYLCQLRKRAECCNVPSTQSSTR